MRRSRFHTKARDLVLDDGTAERMLRGDVAVDDAPPGYRTVVAAIDTLAAPPTAREREGRTEAVASMLACLSPATDQTDLSPRRIPRSKRRLTQLTAAGSIAAVALFGGLTAASGLPGAAGGVAHSMLDGLGLASSGTPNSNSDPHPETRGQSDSHPTADGSDATDNTATATDADSSSRSDGLTTALGNVTDNGASDTASAVLNTLVDGTPGPGLGGEVSSAASDGNAHVPTSVPPAAQDTPAGSHVPTSLPVGGKP
jgi:hypothetical protein